MKKIVIGLSILALSSCATMNTPVAQLTPNKATELTKKYEGKTLAQVTKAIGNPGSRGHWGAGDYAFMTVYPVGEQGSTIPQYKFGMIKSNWQCYFFRFDKEKGDKLIDVEQDQCDSGRSPATVDHDYFEQHSK